MAVRVGIVNKNEQAEHFGQNVIINTANYQNALNSMPKAELYQFVLNDHTGSFKGRDGQPIRNKMFNAMFDSLMSMPSIPTNIKQAWASMPVDKRGASIANFYNALIKFKTAIQQMIVTASGKGTFNEARNYIASATHSLEQGFLELCNTIASGQYVSNQQIGALITARVNAYASTLDPNSSHFQIATYVHKFFDPVNNVWVDC